MSLDHNSELRRALKEVVAAELRVPAARLSDGATLNEIGLDSLAFAEVVIAVEQRLARPLDAGAIARRANGKMTLRELLDLMATP